MENEDKIDNGGDDKDQIKNLSTFLISKRLIKLDNLKFNAEKTFHLLENWLI